MRSKNNLLSWAAFCKAVKSAGENTSEIRSIIEKLDFYEKDIELADINRVNARYRLAKEIKYIEYDSYSKLVADAYTALFKAFLTYTVFERYMKLLTGENSTRAILKKPNPLYPDGQKSLATTLNNLRNSKRFFEFVKDKLNRPKSGMETDAEKEMRYYLEGNEFQPIAIMAAVRHVFAHGKLTPSANKSYPKNTTKILNILTESILEAIDNDFSERVGNLKST